jgi:hypothetical protein
VDDEWKNYRSIKISKFRLKHYHNKKLQILVKTLPINKKLQITVETLPTTTMGTANG